MSDKEEKKLPEEELDAVSGAGWSDVTDWFKKNASQVRDKSGRTVNVPCGEVPEGEATGKAD